MDERVEDGDTVLRELPCDVRVDVGCCDCDSDFGRLVAEIFTLMLSCGLSGVESYREYEREFVVHV